MLILNFFAEICEKQKFHREKGRILIKNIDINKIVVSNKVSIIKKGFKDIEIRTLCKFLPKMSAHREDFH